MPSEQDYDFTVRKAVDADWPAIWEIIRPVIRSGETYAIAIDISEADARCLWLSNPAESLVAEDSSGVVGAYYIKPNQSGPGSHVCNCGYVVDAKARGKGIASMMCEHSQELALDLGFKAMQYNLVVSTNQGAVRLWQKHGFQIVGTLPLAFHHPSAGYVDAFVMYKQLVS